MVLCRLPKFEFTPILPLACSFACTGEKTHKMITLKDFQVASFEKKCDVVTCSSDYLITREAKGCKVYLYYVDEFFVEVYYSPMHKKVLKINAFNDMVQLAPYADMVSLAGLNR
jgi:hypothetical protein